MRCPNCGQEVNVQQSGEYQPIGMWGYFGYEILFSIPLVGLICLIIFSVGGTRNVNLKNFARSYFCYYIVLIVLSLVFGSMLGLSAMFD